MAYIEIESEVHSEEFDPVSKFCSIWDLQEKVFDKSDWHMFLFIHAWTIPWMIPLDSSKQQKFKQFLDTIDVKAPIIPWAHATAYHSAHLLIAIVPFLNEMTL